LNILRLREDVVVNLIEERRHADALGPLLWDALFQADTRTQAEKRVEVVEAVGYTQHSETAFGDVAGVIGWHVTRHLTPSNSSGNRSMAASVETPPKQRLNSPMIMSRVSGRVRI